MSVAQTIRAEHQTVGHCIGCDALLRPRKKTGRPPSVLCGQKACLDVYNALWRSAVREIAGKRGGHG